MDQLLDQIEKLKTEIASAKTDNAEALETFRTRYLGTRGLVKALMGEMKNVPPEQKKEFGQVMNAFKQFAEEKYETLKSTIGNGEVSGHRDVDLSMTNMYQIIHFGSLPDDRIVCYTAVNSTACSYFHKIFNDHPSAAFHLPVPYFTVFPGVIIKCI